MADTSTTPERLIGGSARAEWRSGWPIVLAATIGIAIAGMYYPVVGAMMRPLADAYGWSRGEIAVALTISAIIGPISNILVGIWADRVGPRRVVLVGGVLFGLTYALFGLSGPAIWTWYAAAALFACAVHLVGSVVWTLAVVRHFHASRGLALALSLSGSGIVASLAPAVVLGLLDNFGVRGVFFALAAGAAIGILVPAFFFLKTYEVEGRSKHEVAEHTGLTGLSLREALRSSQYWRLAIALLMVSATIGTFVVHFQSMLVDGRLTPAGAATVALIIGPMMILGRLSTGLLFDRLPPRLVASGAFVLPMVGCLMMLGFDGTVGYGLLCAAVIGAGTGAEVDVVAYLTSRYFGLKHYGVLFGLLIGIYGLGIGVGAALAARVFDISGSYDPVLIVLAAGCGLSTLLAATLGKPRC